MNSNWHIIADKHFLYHPDLPTEFLDRPEASIFKQLVGGDPLWANRKNEGDGRIVMQGHFPFSFGLQRKTQNSPGSRYRCLVEKVGGAVLQNPNPRAALWKNGRNDPEN